MRVHLRDMGPANTRSVVMFARNCARVGSCAALVVIFAVASDVSSSGTLATAGDAHQAPSAPTGLKILRNAGLPTDPEPMCPGGRNPSPNVLWCDNFQAGNYLTNWAIGSSNGTWPRIDFGKC